MKLWTRTSLAAGAVLLAGAALSAQGIINGAGATPVQIPNVQVATGVGFGMAAAGANYPAIYLTGKYNNVAGVFQSLDGGTTWTRINDDKHQWGGPGWVTGDMRIFGRVYVSAGRGGVIVGDMQ